MKEEVEERCVVFGQRMLTSLLFKHLALLWLAKNPLLLGPIATSFLHPCNFELNGLLKTLSGSSLTPLLVYKQDPHLVTMKLQHLAHRSQAQLETQPVRSGVRERELSVMFGLLKEQLKEVSYIHVLYVSYEYHGQTMLVALSNCINGAHHC